MVRHLLAVLLVSPVCLLLHGPASYAEEDPPGAPPAAPTPKEGPEPVAAASEPTVAVVRGQRVNLRVGPRQDTRPVRTLDDGTVLLIVERVPGWLGVRVPIGFPVSVAATYTEAVGIDAIRINARNLNLRVTSPEPGAPMPGAFRDRAAFGAVLPLIERTGEWLQVMAPEGVRAYVSDRFVRELGPLSEHEEIVEGARKHRRLIVRKMAADREEAAAQKSGLRLREALGTAQQALYKLRLQGGHDRTPVVLQINALEKSMEQGRAAPVDARKLAAAVRADLEAELEMRLARKDAEVARLGGLEPIPVAPKDVAGKTIVVHGEIRWEAAPKWRNGGAYVLWQGEVPTHVLRLTTGLPRPLPNLKGSVGRGVCSIEGTQPGEKVFGLPVVEVRRLKASGKK